MLVIRLKKGWTLKLERKLGDAGGWGLWDFHRSESTYHTDGALTAYRLARIKPSEPKNGQEVEVVLLNTPNAPEEVWIAVGAGVANEEADR